MGTRGGEASSRATVVMSSPASEVAVAGRSRVVSRVQQAVVENYGWHVTRPVAWMV